MMRPRARGDKRKGGPQIPARNANSGNENERHGRLGRSRGREKNAVSVAGAAKVR